MCPLGKLLNINIEIYMVSTYKLNVFDGFLTNRIIYAKNVSLMLCNYVQSFKKEWKTSYYSHKIRTI